MQCLLSLFMKIQIDNVSASFVVSEICLQTIVYVLIICISVVQ